MGEKQAIRKIPSSLEQTGIGHCAFTSSSVYLEEVPNASLVRLHHLPEAPVQASAVVDLPARTGQCAGGNPAVLCLRPAEWLFFSEASERADLLRYVQSTIEAHCATAWDNSDGLGVFRLSGDGAPWLLSKLSCLDYRSGVASGPHCARTRMGHVAVIVHYHEVAAERFVFDLIFDRSIAKYLWELLIASAPHADDLVQAFGSAA